MLLLQALPTSIGVAAIAPALLVLWLVIAADERPGPPVRVWLAFLLGAASISLLGIARAPFAAILAVPGNPWMTQGLRSVFGVAAPEEIVKVLVIVVVSMRRRNLADPMDTVVYGAAAGLGFAAYENLAYLVQHADMWRSLAALRSVLTVPFHGALGVIAGAYVAIARAGTALGANRHNRDWARISSWALALFAPVALHAAFDFPLLTLQKHPDLGPGTRMLLGGASLLIGFSSIGFCHPAGTARRSASCAPHRNRTGTAEPVATDVGIACRRRRRELCRRGVRADFAPPLVRSPGAAGIAASRSARPYVDSDRPRAAARHLRCLRFRPQPDPHVIGRIFVCARTGLNFFHRRFRPTLKRDRAFIRPIRGMTRPNSCAIDPAMINVAASNYWYFSFDSSLAVGGSRSI
jgi:RsiW-degrading membrane proteinase PrsW (M82 family)